MKGRIIEVMGSIERILDDRNKIGGEIGKMIEDKEKMEDIGKV